MTSKIENKSLLVASIDSICYRISLSDIEIINNNLLDKRIKSEINTRTGEVIEETPIKKNSLKILRNGYHIYFGIQRFPDKDFLVIHINSYLLENRYLEGISMQNIELIYTNIMKCEVVKLTFEDFLSKGILSDIDIKKDVTISKDEFRKGIKELHKASLSRKAVGLGSNPFNNNNNLGIEWNSREKATPTAPFIKIYCKELQSVMKDAKLLKDEEQPFFETYVGHQNLKDVVRIETTIKNLKSARRYGIENLSLLEVLKLTSEQLNKIIVTALNLNLERRTPIVNKIKNLDKLTPNELLIYIHIDNMIRNQNNDIEMAIEYTLNYFEDKVAKSRMKAKLLDVYSQHIERQTYVVKSKKINEFFTNIGWS
jgi:hypothetical protein